MSDAASQQRRALDRAIRRLLATGRTPPPAAPPSPNPLPATARTEPSEATFRRQVEARETGEPLSSRDESALPSDASSASPSAFFTPADLVRALLLGGILDRRRR